jgi:hypothetical protein
VAAQRTITKQKRMKKPFSILAVISILLLPVNVLAFGGTLSPGGGSSLTPGQWVPNTGAGTITPNPSNLQVPCANIVGGCSGGSSTSSVKYSVCASGCAYSTLQSAIDSVSSTGGNILVASGTYTINTTTTFSGSDIHICGVGDATVVQFDGSAVPYAFANNSEGGGGTIHYRNELCNMKIQTTAVGQGVVINLDKMQNTYVHGIHGVDVNGCVYANANQAFYNHVENVVCEPEGTATGGGNYGAEFLGSANDNYVFNLQTIPSVTASTTGVIVNGTAGIWIDFLNSSNGGVGVDIQTGSNNNSIINSWLESNYNNVQVASGVKNTTILGDHLSVAGNQSIVDSGTGTFVESLVDGNSLLGYGGDGVKFGIGTDNPQFNLDVQASTSKAIASIDGAGSAEVQSALLLWANSSLRGAGMYMYDSSTNIMWYAGRCYNTNDDFCINRQTNSFATSTVAANPVGSNVTNLVKFTSSSPLSINQANGPTFNFTIATSSNGTASVTTSTSNGVGNIALTVPQGITFTTTTQTYSSQVYASTTVTSITGTTSTINYVSTTLPANILGTVGQSMRITVYGMYLNNSGASLALTSKVVYGGQTLLNAGSTAVPTGGIANDFIETFWLSNASGTANNQIGGYQIIANGISNQKQFQASTVDSTQPQSLQFSLGLASTSATVSASINSVSIMLDGATTTVVTGITPQ